MLPFFPTHYNKLCWFKVKHFQLWIFWIRKKVFTVKVFLNFLPEWLQRRLLSNLYQIREALPPFKEKATAVLKGWRKGTCWLEEFFTTLMPLKAWMKSIVWNFPWAQNMLACWSIVQTCVYGSPLAKPLCITKLKSVGLPRDTPSTSTTLWRLSFDLFFLSILFSFPLLFLSHLFSLTSRSLSLSPSHSSLFPPSS